MALLTQAQTLQRWMDDIVSQVNADFRVANFRVSPEATHFVPGKPSVEQASTRMVSSVILVHWCNDVLVLPYLWSMDVIGHKYESAYHLY